MTYAITITEPGTEPVTVSLEWSTEAPKVAGLYFADLNEVRDGYTIVEYYYDDQAGAFETGSTDPINNRDITRWLGPIPMPPNGA